VLLDILDLTLLDAGGKIFPRFFRRVIARPTALSGRHRASRRLSIRRANSAQTSFLPGSSTKSEFADGDPATLGPTAGI
jgi:hypothetical protein